MKKVLSVLLSFVIIFSVMSIGFVSNAASSYSYGDVATPYWTNISSCTTYFDVSGLKATATASLNSCRTTNLSIKIELQKEKSSGYETVETWNKSHTGMVTALEVSKTINPFSNYRIKVTFNAGGEVHVAYQYE